MGRLTERFSNGQAASYWCGDNCKYDHKYCYTNAENCPAMSDIYEKLAHYEDMEETAVKSISITTKVYVVQGFEKNCDIGWLEKEIYGIFTTEKLAEKCINDLTEKLEYIDHFEIETVQLDEFGYK